VAVIEIGAKTFMCIGALPPRSSAQQARPAECDRRAVE
jgi:hypothetical protein